MAGGSVAGGSEAGGSVGGGVGLLHCFRRGLPQSLSLSANGLGPNLDKPLGISPSRLLFEKSRETIDVGCIVSGISPENPLPWRCNSVRFCRFIRESGIFPVNLLLSSQSFCRGVMGAKKSSGISSEKLLLDKYRAFKAPSLLNSGIAPVKKLF